ncbi:MAG TPA: RagB/SusD family nutrient uptake outer membrane protein [Chitinophagaceae bacterium]|nr:RagB/SusD family nutrient uptake outer membrane protein [Chitinophagaceae bacterium]
MKKKILLSIATASLFIACTKKILDKRDLTGIGDQTWDNESTATLYLNRAYSVIMPHFPANAGTNVLPYALHDVSDESNTARTTAILFGTLGDNAVTDFGNSPTSNTSPYANIRRVNILLTEIDKGTLPQNVRTRLKAEAYFLRAWNYWNLVKTYGGVPYITRPQEWEAESAENTYTPRNKTSECIDSLMRDLDLAALAPKQTIASQPAADRGRITRGAALALKGRILLHYASPQFNPTNIQARWENAYKANRAAYDSLLVDGHALFPNFANVWTDETSANKEVIMIRSYNGTENQSNSYENSARPRSEGAGGQYQPTWDLVKAFPMKNGMAITEAGSGYDPVYFWKDRDPRFNATIVYNGDVWPLSGQTGRKQWTYQGTPNPEPTVSTTGFYTRKGINTATTAVNAANGTTDWVEIRLAEVMLNLAECANATGRISEAYDMLYKLRQRAGITPGTGSTYGLKAGMSQSEMFTTIINERFIELAFENKRYDDLRRTKLWTSLNGKRRQKLNITVKAPYTAATLNNFIPGSTTIRVRDTININGPSYTQFFNVTVADLETTNINFLEKYYFYGIPATHLGRNPNLKNTLLWTAGTFDPLQ